MGVAGAEASDQLRVLELGTKFPPHGLGGYERLWQATVAAQCEAGHVVRVLCTDHLEERARGAPDAHEVHRELRWYWRDYSFPPRARREVVAIERWNARVLKRHVTELRPHVAILWAMGGLSLGLAERLRRAEIPVLAVVADAWPAYGLDADAWTRAWRHRPRLGRAVDAATGMPTRFDHHRIGWLFISRYLADRARARFGLDPATVQVASPGIDRDCFRPRRESSSWRWRLLYAGRFDIVKGVDVAVDALGELPPAATLTLDGDGDPAVIRDLRSRRDALGLNGRVRFTCSSPQTLARAYADADVVLFPVRWEEPWGLVPLEAMAVGVPVVSTRLGGCAEYLRDGENCLVVPRDDAGALAAAVRRLAHEPDLRARLRAGGLATAARYPAQSFFDALISAVERLARRDPGAR